MRVAVTGATGLVGYGLAAHLTQKGHGVTGLGRRPVALPGVAHQSFDLTGPLPDLTGIDALVHAAFSHVPARYRGGEGDDPAGFRRTNRDDTLRLFARAQTCGVRRIVFLSSRAVYDGYPAGTVLTEALPTRPESLYGLVKAEVEDGMTAMAGDGLAVASLRATGVYGPSVPGRPHKWADLFASFDRGETPSSRIGTEVHSADLAAAVDLLLTAEASALLTVTFNASDIVLDRHDLLAIYADLTSRRGTLPPRSDPSKVSVMQTDRLQDLGWKPRGMVGLRKTLLNISTSPLARASL